MEDSWVQAAAIFHSNANTEVTKGHPGQKAGLQHRKPISSLFHCNALQAEWALITPYQSPRPHSSRRVRDRSRIPDLLSCELWNVLAKCVSVPSLEAKWSGSIPTAQAAEGWAIIRGQGVLWICKSVQQLACTKEDFFFFNDNTYSLVSFKLWRPTHLNVPNVYWKFAALKTPKLWSVTDRIALRHT